MGKLCMRSGFAISIGRRLFAAVTILSLIFMINTVCDASETIMSEVVAVAIDPHDPQVVYVTMVRGLYKSTDGGEKWIFQSDVMKTAEPLLALNPDNPSTIYSRRMGSSSDIFIKSDDGGKSWNLVYNGVWRKVSEFSQDFLEDLEFNLEFKCRGVNSISVDPKNSLTLYLGTTDGVCKSIDGGLRWKFVNEGLDDYHYVYGPTIYPQNTSIIYAYGGGIFKSIDAGANWRETTSHGIEMRGDIDLTIDPNNSETVYAVTDRGGANRRLYKSVDGGASWQHLNIPSLTRKYESGRYLQQRYVEFYTIAIANDSSVIYAGVNDGGWYVYRSVDGGLSWQAPEVVPDGGVDGRRVIAIDPKNPRTVYSGGYYGMYKSTDGGRTWREINEGLPR